MNGMIYTQRNEDKRSFIYGLKTQKQNEQR